MGPYPEQVDRRAIIEALHRLGVNKGDLLVVHSSLRSIGHVVPDSGLRQLLDSWRGRPTIGAETLIQALQEAIGPEGTLVFPTFTWWYVPPWHYRHTPSDVGLVTEVARHRPEFTRSLHPSHSIAATGPLTEALVKDHYLRGALCRGSPFDDLAKRGGRILLLGVDQRVNSMIHVGESYAELPYRRREPAHYSEGIGPQGRFRANMAGNPECAVAFNTAEYYLRRHQAITDGYIGKARCQLQEARAVIEATVELLSVTPDALLCRNPECLSCQHHRQILASAGLTAT